RCASLLHYSPTLDTTASLVVPIFLFFFPATATTEIYTLSLHDALPICDTWTTTWRPYAMQIYTAVVYMMLLPKCPVLILSWRKIDRKSTRLNSSHVKISYAVFCLKKKKKTKNREHLIGYIQAEIDASSR